MRDFVVDTTDNRMMYVGMRLVERGYTVVDYENYSGENSAIYIFSPAKSLNVEDIGCINIGSSVCAGRMREDLASILLARDITYLDILSDEVYAYENAMYTAEVAIMLIVRNTTLSLSDMNVLILGYGRVGKAMANVLCALNVKFAIAARRYEERASAYLVTSDIRTLEDSMDGYDVIVNTIPARIIDRARMNDIKSDTYVLDLASYDVMDRAEACEHDINYAVEHGLPGRYVPRSAGDSLARSVLRTLEV